ncbi:hypothetical protein FXO37_18618 [Capsicum annuum]|nr:hypothetical protein FXO37_18618 [Capsicum annuum]
MIPTNGQPPSLSDQSDFPPLPSVTNISQLPNTIIPNISPLATSYAAIIQPNDYLNNITRTTIAVDPIPIKKVDLIDGILVVKWTEQEVNRMNIIENLQYAIIGKFSYSWSELSELRDLIPKQCGIKGECKIGFLRNRHILMRFDLEEDFINIMSKNAYYINAKDGNSYQKLHKQLHGSHFQNPSPPFLSKRHCSHWHQLWESLSILIQQL